MALQLSGIRFDANDPLHVAVFWAGLLGWELVRGVADSIVLLPDDDTGFWIRLMPTQDQKAIQNHMHFDLTSTSLEDQQETVERALELGARHLDIGQRPDEGHVVLADPERNEFCVIEPGNQFLADCGAIGAVACDGSREVGYFWSEALDWPLVWDVDQETAIRSPLGGPKITWGGPPLMARTGGSRVRFELTAPTHGDPEEEVNRLASLGATRLNSGTGEANSAMMNDPDGREFCLWISQ